MPLPASSEPGRWPGGVLDRAGAERDVDDLIGRERGGSATRVLLVHGDAAPVSEGRLLFAPVEAVTRARAWAFLGRASDAAALLVAVVDEEADAALPSDARWAQLRAVGGDLPREEAEILGTAVALAGWLRDAAFCPACGAETVLRHAGWSRHCPSCGREHFPRTDPAVIVLVTSAEDPDRVLLGANAAWGGSRYSCFAGFAEAGESLEDTVAREVCEESGVRLENIAYRGSQVWPYPRSLMLGFRAQAVRDDEARPDGEEIVEVRWFDRAEIGAGLRGESAVQLPGAASIAYRLIDDWYRGNS